VFGRGVPNQFTLTLVNERDRTRARQREAHPSISQDPSRMRTSVLDRDSVSDRFRMRSMPEDRNPLCSHAHRRRRSRRGSRTPNHGSKIGRIATSAIHFILSSPWSRQRCASWSN